MDAIVDILDANGLDPSKKWVDDLAQFRFPVANPEPGKYLYRYSIDSIFAITEPLGVPWKLGKCTPYGFVLIYLGFLWNLIQRFVSLPDVKRLKYLRKLEEFTGKIQGGRVSLKDCMSINGTLSHITFVFPLGRAYLTNLCSFISSFPNHFATRYPPHSVLSDMRWWLDTLQVPTAARLLTPRGPLQDIGIWVDASTSWGIGVIVNSKWAAWKLRGDWKANGRDIGWAEMIAVELAVRYLESLGHRDADILVRSDNEGVVGAFNRGRSRNFQVNHSIRHTHIICTSLNLRVVLQYVNTKDNLADSVSRGEPGPRESILPPLLELPEELRQFLLYES